MPVRRALAAGDGAGSGLVVLRRRHPAFLIGGVAILASEFAWAATLLERGKSATLAAKRWAGRIPLPALVATIALALAAVTSAAYWWFVRS